MTIIDKFNNLSLTRFLEEIELNDFIWVIKRLSGNDTGLTGGHQAGLYLPRSFFEYAMPEICTTKKYNPEVLIEECYFPAESESVFKLRAVYYNSKYFPEKGLKKKYDEFRLTRWGGRNSPVQNADNTGSICIFAIKNVEGKLYAVAWVAASILEENLIESWLGCEVEPGRFLHNTLLDKKDREEKLVLPAEWYKEFPTGREIFEFIVNQLPRKSWKLSLDHLLLKRRELEFDVFELIENKQVLPRIVEGFETVEEFIKYAHSISNRRKARSGASLELNLEALFIDENLSFETQVVTENKKKPDFIFPSQKKYHDYSFPAENLDMMAAKTCCKDRWRQILNEADRISFKHLFTLQQGISSNQLKEMYDSKVILVVPKPYLTSYPKDWRSSILTLESFVDFIKEKQKI